VIRWNLEKDLWLRNTRDISFQEIADLILAGDYIDILENPSRKGQEVFVFTSILQKNRHDRPGGNTGKSLGAEPLEREARLSIAFAGPHSW